MPKVSASTLRSSHQDEKKRSDATKVGKHRKPRFVEEVIEPVEPGKPRPLKRTQKVDRARFGRKMQANYEENVSASIIPAEVYAANPVNLNVPRVVIPTSGATAKRKQATATEDNTDVDESEDLIVVPAGFIEAVETLGLLNAPAGPLETLEEPPSPVEQRPTWIETPLISPLLAAQAIYSATQSSHVVPEPMLVELVNDNQTGAATSPPEIGMPMPHAAPIIPESFHEAVWSSASQFQDSRFFQNNMNGPEAFHFHQQDILSHSYLGSTDDDVDMKSVGEDAMEPPDYFVPTLWTSFQPQPEHQTFYPQIGQVADNINQYQTYTLDNIHVNWASMAMQNEYINHINQPQFNHPVDPLVAAFCFWETLSQSPATVPEIINSTSSRSDEQRPEQASEMPGTSLSPTTVPEIIESTPTQNKKSDEQRPNEEPSKTTTSQIPICQDSQPGKRQDRPHNDLHPFPHLRGCKNMKLITMRGESEESRIIRPKPEPGHRRRERPPMVSEMDLVAHLKRVELEDCAAPQVECRK